jgi:RNA ligase
MRYQFPLIRTIDDVLPHIEGRDEFIVAERDYGTIINYSVSFEDTFPPIKVSGGSARMRAERALTNAMRRECRGLIFYPDGRIMSRPLHKFFNAGEREETLPNRIDLNEPHVVMEKMDGSMIRPVMANGYVRLGTKMGVTEVSMSAESYLASRPDAGEFLIWLERCVKIGLTPLFEFVSPSNQIVLNYSEPDLVLLAIRHNETGEYLIRQNGTPKGITLVPEYGSIEGNLMDYLARARLQEGREGDIIRFADGHMIKIKNDWYVRIHKVLDRVRFDRHIVDLILTEKLDDAVPLLPQHAADRVRDFADRFSKRLHHLVETYERYWNTVVASGLDRKRYAQEWMPTIKTNDPFAAAYVFGRFGDRDGRTMILDHIQKHTSTNTRWDECAQWMGLNHV